MAEIFGAVVSGIGLLQLSAELLDGAMRLKRLYQRTKDAPSLMTDLSFELETISLLLQDIERRRQQDSHDTLLMERAVSRCAEKTSLIQAQIGEFEEGFRKCSQLGRAFVAFKHKELRSMHEDLERWKSSILVAFVSCQMRHNAYQMEAIQTIDATLYTHSAQLQAAQLQAVQHQHLITRPLPPGSGSRELMAHGFVEPEADKEPQNNPKRRRSITKKCGGTSRETPSFHTRISLPFWLTRRVWDLAVSQSHCGWTISLRTHNPVCWFSPIARLCMSGDLEAVQELIRQGRASIFDHDDDDGANTFYWAALSGNIQLCRFLLSNGGSTFRSDLGEQLSECLYSLFSQSKSRTPLESFYRLCIEEFDLDVEIDDDLFHTGEAEGGSDGDFSLHAPSWKHALLAFADTKCLKVIHQNQTFRYVSQPEQDRFRLALSTSSRLTDRPNTMLQRAGLEGLTYDFATSCSDRGESALYVAARNLGSWIFICLEGEEPGMDFGATHEQIKLEWTNFATEVLKRNDKALYLKSPAGYTPFAVLLKQACFRLSGKRYRSQVSKIAVESIERWTGILLDAGIDLASYTSRELKIWTRDYKGSLDLEESVFRPSSCSAVAPLFGQVPSTSSIALQWRETLETYTLLQPPGAWPTDVFKTSIIPWKPDPDEKSEGTWKLRSAETLSSHTARDARVLSDDCDYALFDQFRKAEDDTGCIAMRVNRRKRVPYGRRTSSSQPPPMHRRLNAYHGVFKPGSRLWLPNFHLCPYDMQFRFDCILERSETFPNTPSFRDCMQGVSTSDECIQETSWWRYHSWQAAGDSL